MKIRLSGRCALACLALMTIALPLQAADKTKTVAKATPSTTWIYPVIAQFGAIHPRPDVSGQPDPNVDYKVFIDVIGNSRDNGNHLASLDRVARLVNLMGFARVPAEHVHIVALLDRYTEDAVMANAAYRKRYNKDNPNLEILHALKKAGVELLICSQAMAGQGIKDSDIDPSVTITLSGVMAPVVYGQRGYSFMQL